MASKTDITWKGLETWRLLTSPHVVHKVLREQVGLANKKLAVFLVDKVRSDIKAKNYAKNAILTQFLKGSSTPLIDQADLWQSVSSRHVSPWMFRIGVIREDAAGNSIALILHEGATRKVTPKMRAFFRAKAAETRGLVRPLKTSTTEIKIPARPFLKESLVDDTATVGPLLEKHWGEAVRRTFEIVGEKARGK